MKPLYGITPSSTDQITVIDNLGMNNYPNQTFPEISMPWMYQKCFGPQN